MTRRRELFREGVIGVGLDSDVEAVNLEDPVLLVSRDLSLARVLGHEVQIAATRGPHQAGAHGIVSDVLSSSFSPCFSSLSPPMVPCTTAFHVLLLSLLLTWFHLLFTFCSLRSLPVDFTFLTSLATSLLKIAWF